MGSLAKLDRSLDFEKKTGLKRQKGEKVKPFLAHEMERN